MTIQERIDILKPYVIQIRFIDGISVVDTIFKKNWTVPTSEVIKFSKTKDTEEYYMFYSDDETITIDNILDYIEEVININIEREKKYDLLKIKIEELKELFKNNDLNKLNTLKFTFGDEEEKKITDIDINDIDNVDEQTTKYKEEQLGDEVVDEKNGDNINMVKAGEKYIEVPPKDKHVELVNYEEPNIVCKCGPNDACPICVDEKFN